MSNIAEILKRNVLQVAKVDTCRHMADRGTAVRSVLETVARLLDDADIIDRCTIRGELVPDAIGTTNGPAKRADAQAILAEVLR